MYKIYINEMATIFILTFYLILQPSDMILIKKHVLNSVLPYLDLTPSYDITDWVSMMNLQRCSIVEIETGPLLHPKRRLDIHEYFLGLCPCDILRTWSLCSPALTFLRPYDCTFKEATSSATTSARVHRRLCDITGISSWTTNSCNCSTRTLADKPLYSVTGFPTCFISPLPTSICSPRNVCGVFECTASTVHKVHEIRCAMDCHGHQPFCEKNGPITTKSAEINSYWSDWSEPQCNATCGLGYLTSVATCINSNPNTLAIDCLGPGTQCCPINYITCSCEIYNNGRVLKVIRILGFCESKLPCLKPTEDEVNSLLISKIVQKRRFHMVNNTSKSYLTKRTINIITYKPNGKLNSPFNADNNSDQNDKTQNLDEFISDPIFRIEPPPEQDEYYVDVPNGMMEDRKREVNRNNEMNYMETIYTYRSRDILSLHYNSYGKDKDNNAKNEEDDDYDDSDIVLEDDGNDYAPNDSAVGRNRDEPVTDFDVDTYYEIQKQESEKLHPNIISGSRKLVPEKITYISSILVLLNEIIFIGVILENFTYS